MKRMKAEYANHEAARRTPVRRDRARTKMSKAVARARQRGARLRKCSGKDERGISCDNPAIPGIPWCLIHAQAHSKTKEELALWLSLLPPAALWTISDLVAQSNSKRVPAHVRLAAAEAVLDRTGFSRKTEVNVGRAIATMTFDEMELEMQRLGFKIRADESAQKALEAQHGGTDLGGQPAGTLESGDTPGRPVDVPGGDPGVLLPVVRWRAPWASDSGGVAGGPRPAGADDPVGVPAAPGADAGRVGEEPDSPGGGLHGDGKVGG